MRNFLARFLTKASATGPLVAMSHLGRAVWQPRNYARFAEETYQKNIVGFRAIQMVSTAVASIPWQLFDGERELPDHPLLNLIKQPNPQQAQSEFIESLVSYLSIAGDSFIESAGPDNGPPMELWSLRPDRMKVLPGRTGMPEGYEFKVPGARSMTFDADPITGEGPILHLKTFNPLNDWYGQSPVRAAARGVDQRNAADDWNMSLLQNSARPSGAIVYDPKDGPAELSPSQFADLKDEINIQYSGQFRAGRPMVFQGGLKWIEMALTPKDMDFLNVKNTASRDIALAFGVPPQILGIPGDTTFANYEQARLALWEDTVIPLFQHIADEFNNWLPEKFGSPSMRLQGNFERIPALAPRRKERWEMIEQATFLTVNEKRLATGHPSIGEDGDVVLVPSTSLPLGEELPEPLPIEEEPEDDEGKIANFLGIKPVG